MKYMYAYNSTMFIGGRLEGDYQPFSEELALREGEQLMSLMFIHLTALEETEVHFFMTDIPEGQIEILLPLRDVTTPFMQYWGGHLPAR